MKTMAVELLCLVGRGGAFISSSFLLYPQMLDLGVIWGIWRPQGFYHAPLDILEWYLPLSC